MQSLKDDLINRAKAKIQQELTAIENRDDLTQAQKISQIIHIFSAICAGVAVQPIPFADIFLLTPIQAYMGVRLSAVMGQPLSERESTEIIKEIAGVVGLGLLAQQLALGAYKTFVPFLGGLTTIPLVYGLTYAIGRVMEQYLMARQKNQKLSSEQIKSYGHNSKKKVNNAASNPKAASKKPIWNKKHDYTHSLFSQKNMG
jgi:uncharacterized protein (DUF697 family)